MYTGERDLSAHLGQSSFVGSLELTNSAKAHKVSCSAAARGIKTTKTVARITVNFAILLNLKGLTHQLKLYNAQIGYQHDQHINHKRKFPSNIFLSLMVVNIYISLTYQYSHK